MSTLGPEIILVYDRLKGKQEKTSVVIRALLATGIKEECACCHLSEWNNEKIKLNLHRLGNKLDNCIYSVRLLCSNCLSQQPKRPKKTVIYI